MRATYSRLLVLFVISLPLFAMTIVPVTTITMLNDSGGAYLDHQSLNLDYRLVGDDPPLPGPDLGLANWTSNHFKNSDLEDWVSSIDIDGWAEIDTGDRYHWAASNPWPVENGTYSGGIQCRDPSGRLETAEIYKRYLGADADNISLGFDWYVDQNLDPSHDFFYLEVILRDAAYQYNMFYYLNGTVIPEHNTSLTAHFLRYGPANQWNIFQENITANYLAVEEYPDTIDPTLEFDDIYFHIRAEGSSGQYIRVFVDDVLLINETNGYEWIGYTTENGDFEAGDLTDWQHLTNHDAGTVSQSATAYSGSWSVNATAASFGNSSEAACIDSPDVRLTSASHAFLKFYWNLSLLNPTSNSMSFIRLSCDTGVDIVEIYYMLGYGGMTSPISNITGARLVINADNYNTQGSWVLFNHNIWDDIGSYFTGNELFVRDFRLEVRASDANTRVVTLFDACSFAAPTVNGASFEDQPDVDQRVRGWTQTHSGFLVTSTAYAGSKAANLTRVVGTTFLRRQSMHWRPLNYSRETYLDVMWRLEDTVSANTVWFRLTVIDDGTTRELNYYLNGFTIGLGNSSTEGNFNVTSAGTLNTWIQLHRALALDYEAVFGSYADVKMDNLYLEASTVGGGRLEVLFDDLYIYDDPAPRISNVGRNPTTPNVNEAVEVTADVVDQDLSVVELWYEYGSGWQHLTMSHRSGDTYNGTIPGQSYGTVVQYFVNASDEWGMTTWAMDGANPWSYTVADLSPPVVANVAHTPIPVTYLDAAHVTADVSDEGSGLDTVELYYSINGGGWLNTIMTVAGPGTYEATISAQSWNTDVDYYVNATDNMGLITIDDNGGANYTYTVIDNINPVIQNVVRDLGTVQYNDTVEVSCTATDPGSGIATVTLYYRNDSGLWYSTPMSYNGSHYVGIIPEHNSNAVVEYYVEATDNATNSAMSGTDNYTVQDDYPPEISDIDHWPTDVTASDSPDVNCTVIDSGSGINTVTLYYQVDGGGFTSVPMTHRGGGEYNGTIPAQSWGAFVEYYITAIDNNMNSITDNNGGIYYSYTVGDIVGPVIQNVGHTPTEVENDDSPVVSCDVTDPGSGVQFVELYYRIGGSGPFTSVLMTEGVAGHYTASIPIQAYGTFVEYYVNATDWADNWNTDPAVGIYYDYTVVDVTPPDIDNISQTPLSVVFTDSVIVSCDVTDSSTGVSTVMLYYRLNGGLWTSVSMSLTTPDHYEATIGVQPYGTLVEYYVNATDNDDNWVIDDDGGLNYSYTVGDNTDPIISNTDRNPVQVEDTDSPLVGCDVTDTGSGLNTVELIYRINLGLWIHVAMTPTTGDHFEANIPVQIYGTLVEYYVNATDNAGNWAVDDNAGSYYSYTVSDFTNPSISNITQTPLSVNYTHSPLIECEAVDTGSGIAKVELYYRVNGGTWIILLMTPTTGDFFEVNIPAQLGTSLVEYYVNATDGAGNWVVDDNGGLNYSYTVSDAVNPVITDVDTAPSSVEYSATPTIGCDASDVGSGILSVRLFYRVDAGTWTSLTMSFVSGVHYEVTIPAQAWQSQINYYFNVTDNAGNWLVDDNTGSFYSYSIVDTTNPTVSITEPLDQAVLEATVSIVISANDPGSGITRIEIALNGTEIAELTSSPYSYSWDTTQINDGTYTVTITAFDSAGNQASDSIEVIVLNNPIIQPPIPGFPIAAIALAIIAALGIGIYYRRRQPH